MKLTKSKEMQPLTSYVTKAQALIRSLKQRGLKQYSEGE